MDSQFKLQIELDNAAFEEFPTVEIARILKQLASQLESELPEHSAMYRNLKDSNGNTVGTYGIKTNEYLNRGK